MAHATLMLIHHATDMDMVTHAEDLTTTVTAMDTITEMVIHQAHHAETVSESTSIDTDTHAVETITETIVEAICMVTAELALTAHATLMLIHHATDMDMVTHAEDLTTTVTAMDTITEMVI